MQQHLVQIYYPLAKCGENFRSQKVLEAIKHLKPLAVYVTKFTVNFFLDFCILACMLLLNDAKQSWIITIFYEYVTGFAKIDHIVTLGQLHFIGPANSHTHTLPMHHCIDGLS